MRDRAVIVTGRKNSGKTTLVAALVRYFTQKGLNVATIKHAHHHFKIDHEGTDSDAHQKAGAQQTIIASAHCIAHIMHNKERDQQQRPKLDDLLAQLKDADIILIEGYKSEPLPKIICHAGGDAQGEDPLYHTLENVIAIASDMQVIGTSIPVFARNDIEMIARLVEQQFQRQCLKRD